MQQGPIENTAYRLDEPAREPSLWERILGLVEQDLDERRNEKLFVEVRDETGSSRRKEISELSAAERRGLDPILRERVAEQLLDRYLSEQGRVDLVEKRRTYTKKVEDLTPEDLLALVQADRCRTEQERERSEFIRVMRADLEQLTLAGTTVIARQPRARMA